MGEHTRSAVTIGRGEGRVALPRLLLGTAPLASIFWGNEEATAKATVSQALHHGIRGFDSAPFYGLGEAESRLGAGLAEAEGEGKVVIATKVGRTLVDRPGGRDAVFDFSRDAVLASLEASIERLGVDRVDIAHIHDPDDHLGVALDEAHGALCDLRDQGVIAAVSVGTNTPAVLDRFLADGDLDCALLAGRWTLLDRTGGPTLDRAAAVGVAVLAAGVFNSGVLAGPADGAWFDYGPASTELLDRSRALAARCRDHGVDLATAALRFPLRHPAVAAVVVGMAAPDEVDANVAAMVADLPAELWQDLDQAVGHG